MKIINELYLLPDDDQYILYAPLRRTILTVNRNVVAILLQIKREQELPQNEQTSGVIDYLKNLGIIDGEDSFPSNSDSSMEYKPTNVTFLPTSDCNLRCIYCYADSGTTSKYLSAQVAKAALDFVFRNAKDKNVSQVQVGFLGGGEPFLAWNLVKEILSYSRIQAERLGVSTYFTGVTNGVLSKEQIRWISQNFQYLNISLDGMKAIHDQHRPTKNYKGSFDTVINTVKFLNDARFKYSIRSTISSISVHHMIAMVEFFSRELGASKIHFEPLFACGRCRTTFELTPDPKLFTDNFKKCLDVVKATDTELFCSAVRLDTLTSKFCGALDENFYITPDGYVTSCTEVSSIEEPLANLFFIGKYDDQSRSFDFWNDKRKFLSSRTVLNMGNCNKCIAKWHCAGGCPVKAAYQGDIFDATQLANCTIARDLTEYYIRILAHGQSNHVPRIEAKFVEPS